MSFGKTATECLYMTFKFFLKMPKYSDSKLRKTYEFSIWYNPFWSVKMKTEFSSFFKIIIVKIYLSAHFTYI